MEQNKLKEKDIGPIYNFYSSKNEIANNTNKIINTNNDKINDIENSITSSLINHNKKETIMLYICHEKTLMCLKLFLSVTLVTIGIYFLVNKCL